MNRSGLKNRIRFCEKNVFHWNSQNRYRLQLAIHIYDFNPKMFLIDEVFLYVCLLEVHILIESNLLCNIIVKIQIFNIQINSK